MTNKSSKSFGTWLFNCNWSLKYVAAAVFLIRMLNAFTTQTFFQPDEFYQSLEPAHKLVFGYGYLTWEWHQALRSSIHPLIYAAGYKVAATIMNMDLVILVPKLLGAVFATIGEVHLYLWVLKYSNNLVVAKFALLLSLLNPFNWYIITRSFSNSLEMVLSTVALAYWPWKSRDVNKLLPSCFIAFITCIIRPTNAAIWIVLGVYFISILSFWQIAELLIKLTVEFVIILGISHCMDWYFYGYLTFPLYNFVEFNVIKNLSIFYGSSPWHFHLFQSLPIMLMTYLPFFIYSIIHYKLYKTILGIVVMSTLTLFSLISHKEFRFIYPLMPILILFSAYSFKDMYLKSRAFNTIMLIITIVNICISVLFNNINERGEIEVIHYLRSNPDVTDFGFLTPCHSTPWQSHLHNVNFEHTSWFITCEPPLHLVAASHETLENYRDESDQMFDDPDQFIKLNFPETIDSLVSSKYSWPSHLIIYENFKQMDTILRDVGYKRCHEIFNSYFHWDDRRRGNLVIYCK